MAYIKNIKEVTEPLKEQILKGDVHSIDEMRAWLKPLGYSDTINEAAIYESEYMNIERFHNELAMWLGYANSRDL